MLYIHGEARRVTAISSDTSLTVSGSYDYGPSGQAFTIYPAVLVGIGTAFTTELSVGDYVNIGAERRQVYSITDNNHLILSAGLTSAASGVSFLINGVVGTIVVPVMSTAQSTGVWANAGYADTIIAQTATTFTLANTWGGSDETDSAWRYGQWGVTNINAIVIDKAPYGMWLDYLNGTSDHRDHIIDTAMWIRDHAWDDSLGGMLNLFSEWCNQFYDLGYGVGEGIIGEDPDQFWANGQAGTWCQFSEWGYAPPAARFRSGGDGGHAIVLGTRAAQSAGDANQATLEAFLQLAMGRAFGKWGGPDSDYDPADGKNFQTGKYIVLLDDYADTKEAAIGNPLSTLQWKDYTEVFGQSRMWSGDSVLYGGWARRTWFLLRAARHRGAQPARPRPT